MPQPPDDRDRDLARLVTALVNDDPLTREELDAVRLHFAELARLMLISGTIFAAMRMHNRAVARINGAAPNPAVSVIASVRKRCCCRSSLEAARLSSCCRPSRFGLGTG